MQKSASFVTSHTSMSFKLSPHYHAERSEESSLPVAEHRILRSLRSLRMTYMLPFHQHLLTVPKSHVILDKYFCILYKN